MTKLLFTPALLGAALTGCLPVYTASHDSATDTAGTTAGDSAAHDTTTTTTTTGGPSPGGEKRPPPPAPLTTSGPAPDTTATPEVASTGVAGGTEGGSGSTSGDAPGDAPGTTTGTTTTDAPATSAGAEPVTVDKYGKCGWHSENYYYSCEKDGGTPGAIAPNNFKPIDCPMHLVAGAECSEEMGPITNVGCCTPSGDLLYCEIVEMNKIVQIDCE